MDNPVDHCPVPQHPLAEGPASGWPAVAIPAGISQELAAAAEAAGVRVTAYLVEPDGPALAMIADLIDAGEAAVEVEETFPLEQTGAAQARIEAGRIRGKVVLTVTD